jgi:hypothetical protein
LYASGRWWEIAHATVSRRPPISLYRIVARTAGYTYDANVWDLSIVQGIFCRPVPTQRNDSQLLRRCIAEIRKFAHDKRREEAAAAGGKVICLLGNHELMIFQVSGAGVG